MADIKQIIKDTVKPNGEGLITGGTLQGTLLAMVSALDGGAFRGFLTPEQCKPEAYDEGAVSSKFDKSQKWWYVLFAGEYALPSKNPREWINKNEPISKFVGIPKLQVYAHYVGVYYCDGTEIGLLTARYENGRRKVIIGRWLPKCPNVGDVYIVSAGSHHFGFRKSFLYQGGGKPGVNSYISVDWKVKAYRIREDFKDLGDMDSIPVPRDLPIMATNKRLVDGHVEYLYPKGVAKFPITRMRSSLRVNYGQSEKSLHHMKWGYRTTDIHGQAFIPSFKRVFFVSTARHYKVKNIPIWFGNDNQKLEKRRIMRKPYVMVERYEYCKPCTISNEYPDRAEINGVLCTRSGFPSGKKPHSDSYIFKGYEYFPKSRARGGDEKA